MQKRIVSIQLIIAILLSFGSVVFADSVNDKICDESNSLANIVPEIGIQFQHEQEPIETNANIGQWHKVRSDDGTEYLQNSETGVSIGKSYRINDEGQTVEVPLDVRLALLNTPQRPSPSIEKDTDAVKSNNHDSPKRASWFYDYRETASYTEYGAPIRISPFVNGPGSINYIFTTTVTDSFGGSIGITQEIENSITLGSSFNWSHSLSSSSSLSISLDVIGNRTGYATFTPLYNVTRGDIYYVYNDIFYPDEIYMGYIVGRSPANIGGLADGLYDVAYV